MEQPSVFPKDIADGGVVWIVGEDKGDCYFLVGWIGFRQ